MSFFSKLTKIKNYIASHKKGLALSCIGILGMIGGIALWGTGIGSILGTALFAGSATVLMTGCILSTDIDVKKEPSPEGFEGVHKKLCEEFNLPPPTPLMSLLPAGKSLNDDYGTFSEGLHTSTAPLPAVSKALALQTKQKTSEPKEQQKKRFVPEAEPLLLSEMPAVFLFRF